MTAKNMNRCLALVAAILSVFMLLTLAAFADDATAEAATEVVTEATTEAATEDATAEAGTDAESAATTEAVTSATTSATTEAATEAGGMTEEEKTRGLINLIVGGVLLIAVVALIFVFRKKIPGWFKAIKSECGKIVWCPKDKLKKNSFVVLVTIVVIAVVIGVLDYVFFYGNTLLRDLVQSLMGR